MLRLCDEKVTFFPKEEGHFFYVPVILCIEAGECFPAFKQQNILGSPSRELPEGLVQANWIFRSKATLKSSETPFRVKRDRGSEGEKNPKPTSAPSGHLLPKEGGKNRARASPYLYFVHLSTKIGHETKKN